MQRRQFAKVAALAVALGLTGTFSTLAQAEEPRSVFIGVFPTAAPFSYVEDGEYTGISNDILHRVAELKNLKLDYQPMKFDALIPAIQAGQIEMAVSGIFVTEARKQVVDFSDPYYTQGAVLVVPADSAITTVEELKGKTIATEQGSAAMATAQKHAEEWGVTIRVLPDAANLQLAMKTGDVDAMIYDSGIMAYQLKREGDKPTIRMIGDVIDPTGIAFAFPKGSDLIAIVNDGMAQMEAKGEIEAIKNKYNLD